LSIILSLPVVVVEAVTLVEELALAVIELAPELLVGVQVLNLRSP
jgi:hypothetical protein